MEVCRTFPILTTSERLPSKEDNCHRFKEMATYHSLLDFRIVGKSRAAHEAAVMPLIGGAAVSSEHRNANGPTKNDFFVGLGRAAQ